MRISEHTQTRKEKKNKIVPSFTWPSSICFYAQIVWKKTKYIGADWRFRRDGKALLVIKYDPMGNWASAKAYRKNVFPPLYPTTENPLTTTAVAPMLNATNGSATNGSVTIPSTETRQKDEIFAGSTRAVSTALVLAGSLVAVLFAAELWNPTQSPEILENGIPRLKCQGSMETLEVVEETKPVAQPSVPNNKYDDVQVFECI